MPLTNPPRPMFPGTLSEQALQSVQTKPILAGNQRGKARGSWHALDHLWAAARAHSHRLSSPWEGRGPRAEHSWGLAACPPNSSSKPENPQNPPPVQDLMLSS